MSARAFEEINACVRWLTRGTGISSPANSPLTPSRRARVSGPDFWSTGQEKHFHTIQTVAFKSSAHTHGA